MQVRLQSFHLLPAAGGAHEPTADGVAAEGVSVSRGSSARRVLPGFKALVGLRSPGPTEQDLKVWQGPSRMGLGTGRW